MEANQTEGSKDNWRKNKAGNVWKGEVQALWRRGPACIEAFEGQTYRDLPQGSGRQDKDVLRYEKVLCRLLKPWKDHEKG